MLALLTLATILFLGLASILVLATLFADIVGVADAPPEHWKFAIVWVGPLLVIGALLSMKWLYDRARQLLPSKLHAAVRTAPFGETRVYRFGIGAVMACFASGVIIRSPISIAAALWVMVLTFWLDGIVALWSGWRRPLS